MLQHSPASTAYDTKDSITLGTASATGSIRVSNTANCTSINGKTTRLVTLAGLVPYYSVTQ